MGAGTRATLACMASASGDLVATVGEFLPSLNLSHSAGSRIRALTVIARPLTDNGHNTPFPATLPVSRFRHRTHADSHRVLRLPCFLCTFYAPRRPSMSYSCTCVCILPCIGAT